MCDLISGGKDKQDFPMNQGVLTHGRVRLLLNDVQQYEGPQMKKVRSPGPKHPRFSVLLLQVSCKHECQRIALKKQCTKKNKEKAEGCARLLAKRMKKVKKNKQREFSEKKKHKKQIAKR
ncbi:hypothetical protein A6R68_07163, partial [Neotoma lepida]